MTELALYKQQQINKLKLEYNNNIKNLVTKYNTDINKLTLQRNMSPLYKAQLLAKTKEEYKIALNKLSTNLNINIQAINRLTKIPGVNIPNKKALLVGINYNNTNNQLYGCINDANNIKHMLINQYKFQENNIILLNDDPSNNNPNLLPTKDNIINNFKNMLINSKAGDSLFFSYSGHGSYVIDRNTDESDGYDSVLVPINAVSNNNNLIIDDEIKDLLELYLKDGVKLFALLDSCFSGTAMDLKYNYYDTDNGNKITINFSETQTKGQVIMISGCKDNQTSVDAVFIDSSNNVVYGGALTFSFLEALKTNAYSISYKNLLQNIRSFLKFHNYSQIPQLSSGKTLDMELPFSIV
jgi:hypothetical protein